jgi:hypothetical protein
MKGFKSFLKSTLAEILKMNLWGSGEYCEMTAAAQRTLTIATESGGNSTVS